MINLLFLFITTTLAASSTTFKMYDGDRYVEVNIQQQGKLRLTSDCFKGKAPKCDAFTASTKKVVAREPQNSTHGHPAVRYCHDKGGFARILISADNKQYDYCRFNDGSMVDSWDLYYNDFRK